MQLIIINMSTLRCRNCRRDDVQRNLISPCDCDGNQRYVHKRCLSYVIKNFGQEKCPNCRSTYKNIKIKRKLKGFYAYLKENNCLRLRGLFSSTFFISLGFYTVLLGFSQYYQSKEILRFTWIVILIVLVIKYFILFILLTFWAIIFMRKNFLQWQSLNPSIIVTQTR